MDQVTRLAVKRVAGATAGAATTPSTRFTGTRSRYSMRKIESGPALLERRTEIC